MWVIVHYGDFVLSLVLFVTFIIAKNLCRQGKTLTHLLFFLAAIPFLYLGSRLPDEPWRLFDVIDVPRSPLFHSILPYLVLAALWQRFGVVPTRRNLTGRRLVAAVHVGVALGLAANLILDIVHHNDLQWLPSREWQQVWLGGNLLLLGVTAWTPPHLGSGAFA
jgi:hypothetical protein